MLINRAGEELMGIPRRDMIGKTVEEFLGPSRSGGNHRSDQKTLRSGGQILEQEQPIRTPRNGVRIVNSRKLAIADQKGRPQYLLTLLEDLTERKKVQAQLEHLARHDVLTNSPNRTAFDERLGFTLAHAAASGQQFSVVCIDCDRFKEINDVFGYRIGDGVLREIARRLAVAADGSFLARLGGDEFGVIINEGPEPATAAFVGDRLLAALSEDIELQGERVRVGLSMGVALYPSDGTDARTLVANAAAALFRAKADGRGSIRFFEPGMDNKLRERRALKHDLRAAVGHDELLLHYQPLAKIDGQILGFEALLRWRHPVRGMVLPTTFIPPAEESGLVVELGEWVLRKACAEAASWPKPLQIAVNLSSVQFRNGDLPALVHTVLLQTGLAPGRLELEITETVLIGEFSQAIAILRRLKALGVRIAMDDLEPDILRSPICSHFRLTRSRSIYRSSPTSSATSMRPPSSAVPSGWRGLGLPVLAEGVQTEQQLAFLRREACDECKAI